jgi:hypothetical protein
MKRIITVAWLWLAFLPCVSAAVEMANNIHAQVTVATSFDANTGLYTYRYSVTNYGDSPKPVHEFHIPLRGSTVLNITAPRGWEGNVNKSGALVGWCACREDGFVPSPGYVNDGRGIPSTYVIPAGTTLSGFAFQSPYPPAPGIFYAGGWVPIPVEGVDFPVGNEPLTADFPTNLYSGSVDGPQKSDTVYAGGRRPAVDGFLVFLNVQDGGAYSSPLVIDIQFAQNGENVSRSTFRARLNGLDVTGRFAEIDVNRLRAVFEIAPGSALQAGKNTLVTTVDGTVSGSLRSATDTDRIVFLAR